MANRRVLYRVTIVLLIIFLSVQYFYLNPLHSKLPATSSSLTKATQPPLLSLFFFKTGSKRESVGSSGGLREHSSTNSEFPEFPEVPLSSLQVVKAVQNSSSSPLVSSPKNSNQLSSPNTGCRNASNSSAVVTEAAQVYCPMPPPNLLGFLDVHLEAPPSLQIISRMHHDLDLGGHYKPPSCRSRDKVAIVVPFRDREEHLRIFMYNIHPMLKRQMLEYNIFVIEQAGGEPFNRAMLFNVGFVEAMRRDSYDCFIFHDVDLIPENDRNLYNCPTQPRHMSVAIDKMNYQLPYKTIFGGISALTTEHFKVLNGFSNVFWGWGAEDDDMANRIAFRGLYISRPSPDVARYKMLKHKHQKLNNNRYKMLLKGKQRFNVDGLSNLNYTVEQIVLEKLFTLIRVQLIRVGDG